MTALVIKIVSGSDICYLFAKAFKSQCAILTVLFSTITGNISDGRISLTPDPKVMYIEIRTPYKI